MPSNLIVSLLILVLIIAGCSNSVLESDVTIEREHISTAPPPSPSPDVLVGDAERGRILFQESINGAPACTACHAWTEVSFSGYGSQTGPNLYGIGERAATRLPGVSARDYLEESILVPGAFIVDQYLNNMYAYYGEHLSEQDLADLIAYLLAL